MWVGGGRGCRTADYLVLSRDIIALEPAASACLDCGGFGGRCSVSFLGGNAHETGEEDDEKQAGERGPLHGH